MLDHLLTRLFNFGQEGNENYQGFFTQHVQHKNGLYPGELGQGEQVKVLK